MARVQDMGTAMPAASEIAESLVNHGVNYMMARDRMSPFAVFLTWARFRPISSAVPAQMSTTYTPKYVRSLGGGSLVSSCQHALRIAFVLIRRFSAHLSTLGPGERRRVLHAGRQDGRRDGLRGVARVKLTTPSTPPSLIGISPRPAQRSKRCLKQRCPGGGGCCNTLNYKKI